jgi:hypothetical protein
MVAGLPELNTGLLYIAPLRKDEQDRTEQALEAFLDDIEEDKEYRANFMLYKNQEYRPSTESENEEDDLHIGMDEVWVLQLGLLSV